MRLPLGSVPAAALIAACNTGPAGDAGTASAVVRDSAGVRIVENGAPAWEHARPWRLSEQPAVRLGTAEGDPAYQFDRIMGIVVLSDGRIVVGDMGSSQLRFYDRTGRHELTVGRRGSGPGEFRQVLGVLLLAGDTILVDDRRDRFLLFDADGAYIGLLRPAAHLGGHPYVAGVFGDGTVVISEFDQPRHVSAPQTLGITLMRLGPEARSASMADPTVPPVIDTVSRFDVVRMVPGWRGEPDAIVFGSRIHMQITLDGIYTADSGSYEIRKYDPDGRPLSIYRRPWTPVAVDQQHIDGWKTALVEMAGEGGGEISPGLRRQRQDVAEASTFASHFPAFSRMLVDRAGNVWLRAYDVDATQPGGGWNPSPPAPQSWTVFSSTGEWLGDVMTPADFVTMDIGEDYVAGLARDDLDVEYVHVYELHKD